MTDHIVRSDGAYLTSGSHRSVSAEDFPHYLSEIEIQAERARKTYGLLVIPGAEITFEDSDPRKAAHAVAVGLRSFVGLEDGLDAALVAAREEDAALIGAHPYTLDQARRSPRGTARFAVDPVWAADAVDRFELCNRHDFFPWVAEARLPAVATGDFHRPEHLLTWKTVVACEQMEPSVLAFIRSQRPAQLVLVETVDARLGSRAA